MPMATIHVIPEKDIEYREYLEEMKLKGLKVPQWIKDWAKANLTERHQRILEGLRENDRHEDDKLIIH